MAVTVVIPMAGRGERFSKEGFETPKPLIEINGRPMIDWAVASLDIQDADYVFLTREYSDEMLNERLNSTLRRLQADCKIHSIDHVTEGPACTALLSEPYVDPESNLIILNCDQIMSWNGTYFISSCLASPYDGIVVTYDETSPKNSYAKVDAKGDVIQVAEKQVISNIGLNGIHFWRKASFFFESAKRMIENGERHNNEFYIAPSYNQMIKEGQRVGIFHIPKSQNIAVGVPSDLEQFLRGLV